MTLIGYARVSTREQHPEAQTDLLHEAGCERIYIDRCSGKLAKRPELEKMLDWIRPGDTIVITKLDRLGRSVKHLIELSAHLETNRIGLRVIHQGIDTATPAGRMFFHVVAAMAEFERDILSERTHEGLAAARARGRHGGRPAKVTPTKLALARRLLDEREHTVEEIAGVIGVSKATLYRHLSGDGGGLTAATMSG